MRIENMGVRITEVPGFEYIEVKPDGTFELKAGYTTTEYPWSYDTEALTGLRDALTAALEQRAMFAPVPQFHVGQALAGDEELPVGAIVRDSDGGAWHHLSPGRYSMNPDNNDPSWTLAGVAEAYGPITIASLP